MPDLELSILPDLFAGIRIQARRAVGAEMNVDASLFYDRRRRRVRVVVLICQLGLGHIEYLDVVNDGSAFYVDAHGK